MAQKIIDIPGIGRVLFSKRRGSTHLRLSVTAAGVVRVSLPYWAPYAAGIQFAKSRADWVHSQLLKHDSAALIDGSAIGKAHRLYFREVKGSIGVATRVTANEILISSSLSPDSAEVQAKARSAAEKALKKEADKLLPQRLAYLAEKHGYEYKSLKIRKLTSRWGSCSSGKVITLSYFLMQLPWPLIDYVLVHELLHTKFMHHGSLFWEQFESIMPGAKKLRKEVNTHKPRIQPITF